MADKEDKGFRRSFSIKQPLQLADLREKFGDKIKTIREILKEELAKEENKIYDDEIWIMRFLFNPKYSVEKCADRYLKMIEARKEDGVDEIHKKLMEMMQDDPVDMGKVTASFPYAEQMAQACPDSAYHTFDKAGKPVNIALMGRSDLKFLLKNFTKEQFHEHMLWKAEALRILLDRKSKKEEVLAQVVNVVDLAGLGMRHMNRSALSLMQSSSTRVDQMFKEYFATLLVVNAPRVFHVIWAVMRIWVTERTKEKMVMLGSNYKEVLAATIPTDNMPAFLGGDVQSGKIGAFQF